MTKRATIIHKQRDFQQLGMVTKVPHPDFVSLGTPLCRTIDSEIFFPEVGKQQDPRSVALAKRLCHECPYKDPCLQYALDTTQEFGIWGGTTEKMRREIRRRPEQLARRKLIAELNRKDKAREERRKRLEQEREELLNDLENRRAM